MPRDGPLVSIVTPSYNQGRFIEDTLRSVRGQTYPHLQHVVVDGGSTDGTLEVLRQYESSYDLTWSSEEDDGQADAVNKGFRRAKGDVIGWLNSDDFLYRRNTIEEVVRAFQENHQAGVVFGHAALVDANGRLLRILRAPRFRYARMARRDYVYQPSAFFRREVVERFSLDADLEYAMDYDYWLRVATAFEFVRLDTVLAADRNHGARKILESNEAMLEESDMVRRRHGQTFGPRFLVGRAMDKLVVGLPARIVGLADLYDYFQNSPESSFVKPGSPVRCAFNQIFRRSEALVYDRD